MKVLGIFLFLASLVVGIGAIAMAPLDGTQTTEYWVLTMLGAALGIMLMRSGRGSSGDRKGD